jgi:hypothetical protein
MSRRARRAEVARVVEAAYRMGGSDAALAALALTGARATRCPACGGTGMVTPGAIPSRRKDPLLVQMTCWMCVRIRDELRPRWKKAAELAMSTLVSTGHRGAQRLGAPGTGVLSKSRAKKAAPEAPSEDP